MKPKGVLSGRVLEHIKTWAFIVKQHTVWTGCDENIYQLLDKEIKKLNHRKYVSRQLKK